MQDRRPRYEGRHRADHVGTAGRWALRGLAGAGALTLSLGFVNIAGETGAFALDSVYECQHHNGPVLFIQSSSGAIKSEQTIQAGIDDAAADPTKKPASDTASGQGDTVLVCDGTYHENLKIGAGNDNLTVRSEEGTAHAVIVGDPAKGPVVTADDRGLSFGGPGEGFTITTIPSTASAVTGIQLGVPGAQSTANEDEACTTDPGGVFTASGCDEAAPADVTINDQIIGNKFTNFGSAPGAAVTGIQLDNTINSVVQQNLFQNVVRNSVGSFSAVQIGGFGETTPADMNGTPTSDGFTDGDSTNINVAVFQNYLQSTVQGGCTGTGDAIKGHSQSQVNGFQLNGFLLDAQVYDNWLQQLATNHANCTVTGIFSNAYGTLENEQTGTLAPTNANIDRNTITQVSSPDDTSSAGIVLEPTPDTANPQAEPAPMTCQPMLGENCKDTIPPSSYTVVDNELQGLGIAVHDGAVLGANSFIRFNNFDKDPIGVQNDAAAGTQNVALDATNNWWGCELSGASAPPAAPGGNPKNCAALVSPPGATTWAPPQTEHVADAGDHHDHFDAGK
jgi:hypothetical protein